MLLTDSADPEVLNTISWTSKLDPIFQEARNRFDQIRWQYFASVDGLFRRFPLARLDSTFCLTRALIVLLIQ